MKDDWENRIKSKQQQDLLDYKHINSVFKKHLHHSKKHIYHQNKW